LQKPGVKQSIRRLNYWQGALCARSFVNPRIRRAGDCQPCQFCPIFRHLHNPNYPAIKIVPGNERPDIPEEYAINPAETSRPFALQPEVVFATLAQPFA